MKENLASDGLLQRLVRIKCRLVGCDGSPYCEQCGTDLYDSMDYIQGGWLDPFVNLYWRTRRLLKKLGPKRCDQCGKKFVHGYDNDLCSEECHDNWLPF